MNQTIVICGPTATGKSDLGISLATLLNTDVISVDSRQAYKGMDIGTGKDLPPESKFIKTDEIIADNQPYSIGYHLIKNIKHWLFDLARPDQLVNAGLYRAAYLKVVDRLSSEKKIPVLVGGTGFYLKSILNPPDTISIPPDKELRSQLEQDSLTSLQQQLIEVNPTKWSEMNHSDQYNPRRLIRAIEVSKSTLTTNTRKLKKSPTIWIGLTAPQEYLFKRIEARVKARLDHGFIDEVISLENQYPNFLVLPSGKTLGYSHIGKYLNGTIPKDQAVNQWIQAEKQYAKRQLTWFNQQPDILWFDITAKNWYAQVIDKLETTDNL